MFDPSLLYVVYAPPPPPLPPRPSATTPCSPPESVKSLSSSHSSSESGSLKKRKEREISTASDLADLPPKIASCFLRKEADLFPPLPPAPRLVPSPPPHAPDPSSGFALPPLLPASMMSEIRASMERDAGRGASILASPLREEVDPDFATGSAPLASREFEKELLSALYRSSPRQMDEQVDQVLFSRPRSRSFPKFFFPSSRERSGDDARGGGAVRELESLLSVQGRGWVEQTLPSRSDANLGTQCRPRSKPRNGR